MTQEGNHTRALLTAYREQLQQVRNQRERFALLRKTTLRGRSSERRGNGLGNATEAAVLRIEQEREKLSRMEVMLVWRRCVAKTYLNSVSDTVTRMILWMRYMDGLSWKQMVVRHGAGASESAVRMAAVRYMDRHPLTFVK